MDKNKTTVPPTQEELDAKAAAEQAETEAAAAKAQAAKARKTAYKRAMKAVELNLKESTVSCNNAKKWAAWGTGTGAVLAGLGVFIYALKH